MNLTFTRAVDTSRPVPGLELYRVDVNGNVFSYRKASVRRLKPGLGSNGYMTVSLYGKSYCVHKLMQMAFFSNELRLVINHKDGNKQNNHLDNLEELTWGQNNSHAMRTGLRRCAGLKGEQIGTSILTGEQVIEIRRRISAGHTDTAIASEYGVNRSTISHIRVQKTWKHI